MGFRLKFHKASIGSPVPKTRQRYLTAKLLQASCTQPFTQTRQNLNNSNHIEIKGMFHHENHEH